MGELEWIARFLESSGNLRFWVAGTVPGEDLDHRRSM
jgi:hypothetical protein